MSKRRGGLKPSDPKRDLERTFNRRAVWMAGAGLAGFGGVALRLWTLQWNEDAYSAERDENRFDLRIIAPARGVLYDRFGVPLATTATDYRLSMVPERAVLASVERPTPEQREAAITKVVQDVADLLALPPEWVTARVRDARRSRRFDAVLLRQGLTWEEFSRVNVRLPELPGVNAEAGSIRRYPFDVVYAHPIGYVQRPNDRDVTRMREDGRSSAYFRHPDARVGKAGLEARLEPLLDGDPGSRRVVVNTHGRVVSEEGGLDNPAKKGASLVLTLDHELQKAAMERMAGESSAAVLMDIYDGDLLVLASAPGFDPNEFVNGISGPAFRVLNEDEKKPLFHKCVTGAYKPGSTLKMVTGLAALTAGLPQNFRVTCPGYFSYGGRNFHCWKRGGHGTVDMHAAIKGSCNVFFYNAALRAGINNLAAMARNFGLGEAFDVDLPSVEDGIVPDEAWWARVRGGPWPPGNTLNVGIGQGDIQATPLQLAVMAARLANNGLAVRPRIVRDGAERAAPPERPPSLGISPEHLAMVRSGMYAVCNEGGTASRAAALGLVRHPDTGEVLEASDLTRGFPPVQIAGKTGTAQVRIISVAERSRGVRRNQDLEWRLRDHALFVCFGPYDAPRYACAVVVEHGGGGSVVAAPIAADLMRRALLRDPSRRTPATIAGLEPAQTEGRA